jgi:hypothetical protein
MKFDPKWFYNIVFPILLKKYVMMIDKFQIQQARQADLAQYLISVAIPLVRSDHLMNTVFYSFHSFHNAFRGGCRKV